MSNPKAALQATAVQQQCKLLRLPAVGTQCAGLAELAVKERQSHLDYLEALLAAEIRQLAEGGYIERAEPILLLGDCGTGKTHLMTGLCVAACRQKRRVRFT